jgi:hypothetical protein
LQLGFGFVGEGLEFIGLVVYSDSGHGNSLQVKNLAGKEFTRQVPHVRRCHGPFRRQHPQVQPS